MSDLVFRAIEEAEPGPLWASLFHAYWPAYREWWLQDGVLARPTYMEGRRALKRYMPELLPLYDQLCDLAGGSDEAARFLSFYGPPAYLSGCSQAIPPSSEPMLVRNYDYSHKAFDALVLRTEWQGRAVVGSSDGLWGLVDGMNDAGLAVSLTFGGRRDVGEGFGVPLILRYILQTCETAEEAGAVLKRVPTHMSYNVTVVDRKRSYLTAYMGPHRKTQLTRAAVATNHQEKVEWVSHARFSATVERERFLLQRLTLHREPPERFIAAFLKPPLYSTAFDAGFGTLYTAVYRPRELGFELLWPQARWDLSLNSFAPGALPVTMPLSA
ncbi:MAG: C45 family peptidase [Pseudomonadota bacterium]